LCPRPCRQALEHLTLHRFRPSWQKANQAIGRLDGLTSPFPDLKLFLYSYIRKEAVLSSQIEEHNPPCQTFSFTKTPKPLEFHWTTYRRCRITSPPSIMDSSVYAADFSSHFASFARSMKFSSQKGAAIMHNRVSFEEARTGSEEHALAMPLTCLPHRNMCWTAWASSNRSSIWRSIPFLCSCERSRSRAIRDDTSLPRWQRPSRQTAHHLYALRQGGLARTDPLSQLVLQKAPALVLRPAQWNTRG
jgi:hypothetical protein